MPKTPPPSPTDIEKSVERLVSLVQDDVEKLSLHLSMLEELIGASGTIARCQVVATIIDDEILRLNL